MLDPGFWGKQHRTYVTRSHSGSWHEASLGFVQLYEGLPRHSPGWWLLCWANYKSSVMFPLKESHPAGWFLVCEGPPRTRLSQPSFSIITESCLDDSVCRQSAGDPGFWSVDLHTGPRGPGMGLWRSPLPFGALAPCSGQDTGGVHVAGMLRCPALLDLGFQKARGAHRSSALWSPGSEGLSSLRARPFLVLLFPALSS